MKKHIVPNNGFTKPFNTFQIFAWIFFLADIIIYYFLIFPISMHELKIAGFVLETISAFFVIWSAVLATKIDPSDSMLAKFRRSNNQEYLPIPEGAKTKFCSWCECRVFENSKHCRACDRYFSEKKLRVDAQKLLIIIVVGLIIVWGNLTITLVIVLTVQYANDKTLSNNSILLYNSDNTLGALIPAWILGILSIVFLILDSDLVFFHLFLMRKKLTTYDYITGLEEKKEKMDQERKSGMKQKKRTCLDFVLCIKPKNRQQKYQSPSKKPEEKENAQEKSANKDSPQKNSAQKMERSGTDKNTGNITEREIEEHGEISKPLEFENKSNDISVKLTPRNESKPSSSTNQKKLEKIEANNDVSTKIQDVKKENQVNNPNEDIKSGECNEIEINIKE